MMIDITHRTIAINGIDLHLAEAGAGDPILFVHGFPDFWQVWIEQLQYFGKARRAVAPDLRGFNLSSKPAEVAAYRARHIVEDLRQLVEELGGGRAITVVAHDWGGAAVWSLAAAHPELVAKLVIINSPHAITFARDLATSAEQRQASAYMNAFRDAGAEALLGANGYEKLFRLFGKGQTRVLDEAEREAYLSAWSQPGALTGGLNYYRASPLHPPTENERAPPALDPALFRVEVPTLVIWGMADTALLPGLLNGLDTHVSDLTIHRMAGVGHWPMRERPDEVNHLIEEFLAR